jgi:hypothetical protein
MCIVNNNSPPSLESFLPSPLTHTVKALTFFHKLQKFSLDCKAMGIQGKYWRRVKIVINNKIIEVSSFTCLGSKISDEINADLET